MKTKTIFLWLLLALLVGGVNSAWAETVLYSTSFDDEGWDPQISSGSKIRGKGMYFKCESSISSGNLSLNGGNYKSSNYWVSVPVTGINGSATVTITVPTEVNNYASDLNIAIKSGTDYENNPDDNAITVNHSNGTISYTFSNLSSKSAVIYFGRTGSSKKIITKVSHPLRVV